jgi:hypothetical protein
MGRRHFTKFASGSPELNRFHCRASPVGVDVSNGGIQNDIQIARLIAKQPLTEVDTVMSRIVSNLAELPEYRREKPVNEPRRPPAPPGGSPETVFGDISLDRGEPQMRNGTFQERRQLIETNGPS